MILLRECERCFSPGLSFSRAYIILFTEFSGKELIQNNDLKLRPGMFVKADIVVDRADSAIIIPKDVVQSNRRRKFVFIVDKNTAILRNIKTGMEDENNIEVLEGLRENDNLVTKGFETLKENSKVKVQK